MTLVQNIDVPPESADLFYKSCVVRGGFFGAKVDKKSVVWRKRNFKSLIARSSVQGIADIWNSFTTEQQDAWGEAGYWADMSGWDLFAQDTLYRINNGIPGVATPSAYHQFKLGQITVQSPAQQIHLVQNYSDDFGDYLEWAFNVKSALTSNGSGSFAKIIVKIKTGYWLDDTNSPEVLTYEYDLTEFTDWDFISDGYYDGFIGNPSASIEVYIYKMIGSLYIDGVEFVYESQNHARDWQCDFIENNWQRLTVPSGSSFKSIYPPDEI